MSCQIRTRGRKCGGETRIVFVLPDGEQVDICAAHWDAHSDETKKFDIRTAFGFKKPEPLRMEQTKCDTKTQGKSRLQRTRFIVS